MAARKEFPVKVRRVAVTNKKTGVKYIEERHYQYDPAKGYNVLLSSRRTGEKILEGETVTTRCRPRKKPAEAAQTAERSAKRTRAGALDLIRHAGAVAGLESSVRRAYPNGGTSGKLSVSQYLVPGRIRFAVSLPGTGPYGRQRRTAGHCIRFNLALRLRRRPGHLQDHHLLLA